MNRFLCMLMLPLALMLPACGFAGSLPAVPSAPVELADRTTADERVVLALELAYSGARTAGELATDAGLVKGNTAIRLRSANTAAYEALRTVERIDSAANAESYAEALTEAREAIADILAIAKGGTP